MLPRVCACGWLCDRGRYTYLIYNGSVHYWHASRPLQCDQLRSHLLPSAERLNQVWAKMPAGAAAGACMTSNTADGIVVQRAA